MSASGNAATAMSDDLVEEALSDHHLDEIAQMIEQAHAHNLSSKAVSGTSLGDPGATARAGVFARENRA
jgi:hypothetical protein